MSNKLQSISLRGIERNTPGSASDDGGAQDIINLRPLNGAWRNAGDKESITRFYSDRIMNNWNNKPVFFPKFYRHPSLPEKCYVSYWHDTKTIEMCAFCTPAQFNALWGTNANPNWVTYQQFWNDNGTWNDEISAGVPNVWHDFDSLFTIPSNESFKCFAHLNNILIVVTNINRYFFLWDAESLSYKKLEDIPLFDVKVPSNSATNETIYSGAATSGNLTTALGILYARIVEQKKIGIVCGKQLFRVAFELYDGNIIGESNIYFFNSTCPANTDGVMLTVGGGSMVIQATFGQPIITISSDSTINAIITQLADLKLISNFKVYATDVIEITDTESFTPTGQFTYKESINKKFDDLVFYEIYSCEIKEFMAGMTSFSFDINLISNKVDINQIETFPHLTPQQCTLHKYNGETYFNYNNRLHLSDVLNILYKGYEDLFLNNLHDLDPSYNLFTAPYTYDYDIVIDVELDTDKGKKYMRREFVADTLPLFEYDMGVSGLALQIHKLFVYPDYRGVNLYIMSKDRNTGVIRLLQPVIALSSSVTNNISYALEDENSHSSPFKLISLFPTSTGTIIEHEPDNIYTDTNRVQVSEQSNLFIYPAKNSYRFGEIDNVVVGLETTAQELTATRFGQFPLYIFTKQGIFTLEQGSGEVLYSNILPIDFSPCENAKCIININGAVVFMTATGMKLIAGRQVVDISTPLEGKLNNQLLQCPEYLDVLNNYLSVRTLEAVNKSVAFLDEINNYIAAYDRELKELFVTYPVSATGRTDVRTPPVRSDYDYSYIFGKDSKKWYKFRTQVADFIKTFYGYNVLNFDGVFLQITDIETESDSSTVFKQVVYQSRPIKLQSNQFKKLRHIVFRLFAIPNAFVPIKGQPIPDPLPERKFVTVHIYGSPDNLEYKLIGGGQTNKAIIQDIMLRKTYASCRYFIILMVGDVKDLQLTTIDVEYIEAYTSKLR